MFFQNTRNLSLKNNHDGTHTLYGRSSIKVGERVPIATFKEEHFKYGCHLVFNGNLLRRMVELLEEDGKSSW